MQANKVNGPSYYSKKRAVIAYSLKKKLSIQISTISFPNFTLFEWISH